MNKIRKGTERFKPSANSVITSVNLGLNWVKNLGVVNYLVRNTRDQDLILIYVLFVSGEPPIFFFFFWHLLIYTKGNLERKQRFEAFTNSFSLIWVPRKYFLLELVKLCGRLPRQQSHVLYFFHNSFRRSNDYNGNIFEFVLYCDSGYVCILFVLTNFSKYY